MSYPKPPGKPRQGRTRARQPSRGRNPSGKPSSVRESPQAGKIAVTNGAAADVPVGEREQKREQKREPQRTGFPIVGMGASAGGLEAFERFFAHMPPDRGVAFVLVPHLDPTHESLMAELISRHTAMKVQQSKDGTRVEPDRVYLIPPNAILTIQDGILHVTQPEIPRGYRTPINTFFRSLAEDQGRNAICIILSGTGSDGALGFRAIKEHGGMAIAQAEGSAKYQGMPRSAFATGLADWVLPVEEMPGRLIEYVDHLNRLDQSVAAENLREDGRKHLARILAHVRSRTGHDFTHYKENTLIRRIQRRMQVVGAASPGDYLLYLRSHDGEAELLFQDLLIGVTQFMRDPDSFQALAKQVIPEIIKTKQPDQSIRVWVPGCSTGEECYSIAMLILDELGRNDCDLRVQIFASDIDDDALAAARLGCYPETIASDVSQERLERFFDKIPSGYEVSKRLREVCVFSRHDLIKDPPFSRLDLVSCRNVLIYLDSSLQERLLSLFHYALYPRGFLLLGPAETISGNEELFTPIDKEHRIFRRKEAPARWMPDFPLAAEAFGARRPGEVRPPSRREADEAVARTTERLLVESYAPACVVVNERYEALYFSGGTGVYLEPPAGTPDLNVINMARRGLRRELRTALHQAISEKKTIVRENVRVESDSGERTIRLIVRPLPDLGVEGKRLVVIFEEVFQREPMVSEPAETVAPTKGEMTMERELEDTRRQLSTTIEDLETSNEELKSSNEELMSMNEELQSTVEELETSKEELQSVNEELETVNSELSGTLEEIGRINSDLKNLLESTEIATIFLDRNLRIKRYTPRALDLFQLIPGDVGRPLADIAPKHDYEKFVDDVKQVLKDLVPKDHQVRSGGGRVYMMRILPYRTVDNVIDGVVINFVEVSQLDKAKREIERLNLALRYRVAELETVFNLLPIGMALCEEPSGEHVRLNRRGAQLLGVPEHMNVSPKGGEHLPFSYHQDGRPLGAAEDPIQRVLDTGKPVEAQELRLIHEDGREFDLIIAATPLLRAGDKVRGAVASMVDVTERNIQQQELENWAAQQTAIAELGLYVLSGGNVDQLSEKMVERASKTLGVELAEVFALEPDGSKLLLKAGIGWPRELVGRATVPGDFGSQAGFTLRTRTPVIVTDLREETRFNAEFLREHGVVSGVTVVISGSAGPYGVLGVHSRKRLKFSDDDLTFLQALANLISMARIRAELLENQRQMLMREAEEKTRRSEHLVSLGTLAAGIAHEINNPLNAILVNAEYSLLSMDRQDPAALEQSLRTIAAEAKRCGEITNSVLTFSKAEGAPKGLHDLNQVVRQSMDLVGSYVRLFEAVVDLDLDERIPLIRLNPTTMEHALINLLRNAVEAASVGVQIRVRTERLGNRVELTVTDNGPGIPSGDLKRIFDPFFTRRSDSGGTGLGLNLVYRIITDHDGTIEARNAPGGGAMFVIDLPILGEGE